MRTAFCMQLLESWRAKFPQQLWQLRLQHTRLIMIDHTHSSDTSNYWTNYLGFASEWYFPSHFPPHTRIVFFIYATENSSCIQGPERSGKLLFAIGNSFGKTVAPYIWKISKNKKLGKTGGGMVSPTVLPWLINSSPPHARVGTKGRQKKATRSPPMQS